MLPISFNVKDRIEKIEDDSSLGIRRARITFKNGFILSVVKGWGTYGWKQGLFEIKLLEVPKDFLGKDEEVDSLFSDPIGYLTEQEVMEWVYKIALK